MNAQRGSIPLSIYFFGLIILLYLPIALLFLLSVNSSASLSFPIKQLTFDWYWKLFDAEAVLRSARNSLVVAFGSSFAATLLGTMVSILMLRYKFRGQNLLIALSVLPLLSLTLCWVSRSCCCFPSCMSIVPFGRLALHTPLLPYLIHY